MPSRDVYPLVMILLRINMLTLVYSLSFMHKIFPFYSPQEPEKTHSKICAGNIDSQNNLVWKELLKSSSLFSSSKQGNHKVKSGSSGSCLVKFWKLPRLQISTASLGLSFSSSLTVWRILFCAQLEWTFHRKENSICFTSELLSYPQFTNSEQHQSKAMLIWREKCTFHSFKYCFRVHPMKGLN